MRILEIILLAAVTAIPFVKRPLLKITGKRYLLIALAGILILHLIFEGWRWQMFPGYLLMLILIWSIFKVDSTKPFKLTFLKGVGYTGVILLILLGWLLPNLFPVFSLPEPTGPYPVGTHMIDLKTTMDESITDDPTDKRELIIKVWYPADSITSIKQEPYLDRVNRTSFLHKYAGGMPDAMTDYLDRVKTHVYQDAPVVHRTFPVLIFSHGYGSNATGYYALLTEIASHGYVIFNLNHTYESLGAAFPDGRVRLFNYAYQNAQSVDDMKHIKPIRDAFMKDLTYEERRTILREASKGYSVTTMVKRWAKDIVYTIGQLDDWDNEGFFKDRLDVQCIGVFGHSRGGGAAGQAALMDSRIKIAANIDGVQWGEILDTMFQIPILYISSDWPADHEDINALLYKNKSTDYFYECKLLTSAHPNFMDIPFLIPVRSLAQVGAIDPDLGIKITDDVLISFFDKHLKKDRSIDMRELGDTYKLLEMTVYKGDSTGNPTVFDYR